MTFICSSRGVEAAWSASGRAISSAESAREKRVTILAALEPHQARTDVTFGGTLMGSS